MMEEMNNELVRKDVMRDMGNWERGVSHEKGQDSQGGERLLYQTKDKMMSAKWISKWGTKCISIPVSHHTEKKINSEWIADLNEKEGTYNKAWSRPPLAITFLGLEAQVVERLPCKRKALNQTPVPSKTNKQKTKNTLSRLRGLRLSKGRQNI
jgi:hypothetical protein